MTGEALSVGNTPLVQIRYLSPQHAPNIKVWAKMEKENPTGSVKDRIAKAMIDDVVRKNQQGAKIDTIVEASSGNTASSDALFARESGFKCVIVIPYKTSREKEELTKSFGATVIRAEEWQNYMQLAREFAAAAGERAVFLNQYDNPLNAQAHYEGLGPEITRDMGGRRIHAFIAAGSTGGTISGVGKWLKEYDERTQIILADPYWSVLYDEFYKSRAMPEMAIFSDRNPCIGESVIEGAGKKSVPGNMDFSVIDRAVKFPDAYAVRLKAFLEILEMPDFETALKDPNFKTDGLSIGGSAAGCAWVAREIADEYAQGPWREEDINIVIIAADGGEKYESKLGNAAWRDSLVFGALQAENIFR
ncbi:MAG: cysteine synthase family protein [Alphaproteobacteria bacterium]